MVTFSMKQCLEVETEKAQQYLQRLSQHFKNKVDVEIHKDKSIIHFEEGVCVMSASENCLYKICEADNTLDMKAITDTMDRHLFGEDLSKACF